MHNSGCKISCRTFAQFGWGLMLLSILVLCQAKTMQAQTITGSIRGTVTDPAGAIVAGAAVTARNDATGIAATTVTDHNGSYNFQFLPIGPYTITATRSGFNTASVPQFNLQIDQIAKIDVKMQVGKVSTTVTVSSSTQPILNTQNATLGTTFSSNTIAKIPLNGLDFSAVTMFMPGSVLTTPGGPGGFNAIEPDNGFAAVPSFNGNRQQTNDYILDGVEILENKSDTISYNPAPDALQEMRVITGNADAEYGNVNGGEVIMVTKGGTNRIHGSLYEYFQNDGLAANTWSNNFDGAPKQTFSQNQFGATLGGPFLKDKLFYFGDYEGSIYNTSGQGTASVPTAAMRSGDFSQLLAIKDIQLYNTQNGFTPYPNNQIPVVNPVAQFVFAHPQVYPLPNKSATDGLTQNNYIAPTSSFIKNNQGDFRLDYSISLKDALMARYSQNDAHNGETVAVLPIFFPASNDFPYHSFVANWVHTFSPSLVNEARAGYMRIQEFWGFPTDPSGLFGLHGDNTVGIPFLNQAYLGFSEMGYSGNELSSIGTTADGQTYTGNTFDYGDNITWEHGNHIIKFGAQILRYQTNNFYPGNNGTLGEFGYYGQFTANPYLNSGITSTAPGFPYADFVLNQASFNGIGGNAGPYGQRQYRDAFYVQDDWRFRPRLTVNLGLRYGYDQPIYEVNNKQVNVNLSDPSSCTSSDTISNPCLEYAGQNGNSRALYNPYWWEFMPRIGFAWQATSHVVLRGGYGITDDLEGTGSALRLPQNPPNLKSYIDNATSPTATSGGSPIIVQNGFATAPGNVVFNHTEYFAWVPNLRPALIQQFNLTTQYLINNRTTVQVGYVGELGQHLIVPENVNQWPSPCTSSCTNAPFYNLVGQTGLVLVTQSEGISNYNAMQAQIQRQEGNGLEYTLNYTWSKAMTNNVGYYGVQDISEASPFWQNAYDPKADYGPASYDTRNSVNGLLVYQLPFGRQKRFGGDWNRLTDASLGGWTISGDAILYSGFPDTIQSPNNANVNTLAARANQYRPLKLKHQTVTNWFGTDPSAKPCSGAFNGTCAYGPELPNSFGTAHVGSERDPGYRQIDLSIFKSFNVVRSQTVLFRADFFNAFNLASYNYPDSGVTDSNFGQITSTRSPNRQIQFAVDYRF